MGVKGSNYSLHHCIDLFAPIFNLRTHMSFFTHLWHRPVRAFRSLTGILQSREEGIDSMRAKASEDLKDVLPEPTPAMRRFASILELLGAQSGETDPAKFVPIIRKLSQEPRIQQTANEIVARLGERLLSRGLRAAFGLPPPSFGSASAATTVTEDME